MWVPRNHTPCQTPAFQADDQETPGDSRSSVCCHNLPQTHRSPWCQRPLHWAGTHGAGLTWSLGMRTAPQVCRRDGSAAGAKHARRFYLTFTNRSCHSLLGAVRALTGKTSHPVSSGTNWSFPVLEAFITKLFLSSFSYLTWAELCSPQSGTNGVCFLFLFL